QMHRFPRDLFSIQVPQHKPGRAPAAHGKDKPAARGHRVSSLSRDYHRRFVSDRLRIGIDFDFHESLRTVESAAVADYFLERRARRYRAADFSTCPPNWKRMADSNLSWKSASPREVKRS